MLMDLLNSLRKSLLKSRRAETMTINDLHRSKTGKVSDKWESYLEYYDFLFGPQRNRPLTLLEIGVQNGGSLETWAEYFKAGRKFVGCDIDPKCGLLEYQDPRISVVVGDVNDNRTLQTIRGVSADYDIVIDDGSHMSADIINAFVNCFPLLKPGGIYVIEDTHLLYHEAFGGVGNGSGAYALFKKLVDIPSFQFWQQQLSINSYLAEFFPRDSTPSFILEGWIQSVEFRNSVITLRKALQSGHDKLGARKVVGQIAQVQDWKNVSLTQKIV